MIIYLSEETAMDKFAFTNPFRTEKNTLKEKAIEGLRYGIIPTLIQFVILVLVILEFNYLIGPNNGVRLVAPAAVVGGAETNPNLVRLIYLFISLDAAFVCVFFARKFENKKRIIASFWFGIVGGILLWQAIGECAWHFGFMVDDNYVGFPCIEGISGAFILIPLLILLIYAYKKGNFGWGVWIFILSFMFNWLGHFVMEGTYPPFASILSEETWFKITGLAIGIPVVLFSLYIMFFAAKDKKGRLLSSLVLYTGLGIIASGVLGL